MSWINYTKYADRLRRLRHQRDTKNERGFTLVEAVVATLLMGVGVFGASAVFGGAGRTASAAEQRSAASNLASAELERARALPYDGAAIASTAAGYQPTHEGRPTVTNDGVSNVNQIEPTSIATINATDFQITRNISWAPLEVAGTTTIEGYKVLDVEVTWTDSTGDHEITYQTGLYRGIGS